MYTDIFSYNDIVKQYKDSSDKCTNDSDCPTDSICQNGICQVFFSCDEKNLEQCYNFQISDENPKYKDQDSCNSDSDCLAGICEGETSQCSGTLVGCLVGGGTAECGYVTGEACVANEDCLEKQCENGFCKGTLLHKKMAITSKNKSDIFSYEDMVKVYKE